MKRLYTYKSIVASFALLCCMTACQKEKDTVRLSAEFERSARSQNSKTFLSGCDVVWDKYDQVKVNGKTYTVDEKQGAVEVPVSTNGYAALYAPTAGSSLNGTGSSCTGGVAYIPKTQYYTEQSTYKLQCLKAPMVARLDDEDGSLHFCNLYSVIKVKVKNPHIGRSFVVSSIRVTASHTNLAGNMNFSISGSTSPKDSCSITLDPITDAGSKMITLTISSYSSYGSIPSGQSKEFFIYSAPVLGDTLSVEVTGTPQGYDDSYSFEFQKAGTTAPGVTIARNDLASTMVDMTDVWPRMVGKFSVSSTKQVYFSCGNLQYNKTENKWRFAPMGTMLNTMLPANFHFTSPADYIMEPAGSVGTDYGSYSANSGWMSLFGWGTSGESGYNPYMTSTTNTDYYHASSYSGPAAPRMAGTNYDWGVRNAIYNPLAADPTIPDPADTWRTLTEDEWRYLVLNRSGSQWPHNYVIVNFDNGTSMTGLIIYPDGVVEKPSCVTSDMVRWGDNLAAITQKEFEDLLYFVGCAFLPMYSERTGTTVSVSTNANGYCNKCRYWSSSDSTAAWGLAFCMEEKSNPRAGRHSYYDRPEIPAWYDTSDCLIPKSIGLAVRLVKDVQ